MEYNDDEMYYDKHDRMKNQAELDKEDRAHFTDLKPAEPMSLSNSQTRREEKERAMEAWKQAKREEVDDVTGRYCIILVNDGKYLYYAQN